MVANTDEIRELMEALRTHVNGVLEKTAFLELKQSELRPGDEVSFFGFLQAREQLMQEQSLLAGHAHMVKEIIAQENIPVSRADQKLLRQIEALLWPPVSRY